MISGARSCKHCGSSTDIPLTKSGKSAGVCRSCKAGQHRSRYDKLYASTMKPRPPATPVTPLRRLRKPKMSSEEMTRRTHQAHERAKAEGISLTTALKLEGVL